MKLQPNFCLPVVSRNTMTWSIDMVRRFKRTEQAVMGTQSAWTPERRAKQAEIIARTRPWEKSTGPRTDNGKAISSRNAYTKAGDADALLQSIRLAARARAYTHAQLLLRQLSR